MKTKTKISILLAGLVLTLFLSYTLAISKTLDLRQEYRTLSEQELLFKDMPKQISFYSSKQKHFDSILTKMNMGNTSMENNLLKTINLEAGKNKLKVLDFNNPHIYLDNDTEMNTYYFSFEGNFANILKAIYAIEQEGNFGEIIHLYFIKNKDYKTNKNYLNATVFLQNVK